MYEIVITKHFKKQLKQSLKKNPQLKEVVKELLLNFDKDQSTPIGKGVYKLRVRGQSKGKSGGYRLYIFLVEVDGILAPICIYSKSEKENLNIKEVIFHLEKTKEELIRLF